MAYVDYCVQEAAVREKKTKRLEDQEHIDFEEGLRNRKTDIEMEGIWQVLLSMWENPHFKELWIARGS